MTTNQENKSFFSGAMVYLISNILNASIPFILLPILTRFLTPSQYGMVAMFQFLISALVAIVGVNTVGAANRKYFDKVNKDEMSTYVGACLYILAISLIITTLVLLFYQDWISEILHIPNSWIFLALAASAATFIIRLRLGQWQVRKAVLTYGAFQLFASILNGIFSVLLVVYFSYGADGRIWGQTIALLIMAFIGLALFAQERTVRLLPSKKYIKDAFLFGLPLIPHVVGVVLLTMVDRYIINDHLGLDATGIYMVAVQLTMVFALVCDAFNKAYVPWLYEKLSIGNPSEKARIVRWTYTYFAIIIAAATVVYATGPWIVTVVVGEQYKESASVIGILAFGQALNGMYLMVTNFLFFTKRTGSLATVTIITGLLNVVLLLVLVPMFNLVGAATSFVAAMLLRFLGTWWLAQKNYPMPWLTFRFRPH